MEMQEQFPLLIEVARLPLLQLRMHANFDEQRLKEVQSVGASMLLRHSWDHSWAWHCQASCVRGTCPFMAKVRRRRHGYRSADSSRKPDIRWESPAESRVLTIMALQGTLGRGGLPAHFDPEQTSATPIGDELSSRSPNRLVHWSTGAPRRTLVQYRATRIPLKLKHQPECAEY